MLLTLARLCAETRPRRSVEFLFFDAEDSGKPDQLDNYIIGSRRFVRDHPEYRPGIFILLDLVVGKGLRIPMEGYSAVNAPAWTSAIFKRAEELGLGAFVAERGPAVYDDHVPFMEQGIPAVDLIDFDFPQWHTTGDTPDKCSGASLEQVGRLMVDLIYNP